MQPLILAVIQEMRATATQSSGPSIHRGHVRIVVDASLSPHRYRLWERMTRIAYRTGTEPLVKGKAHGGLQGQRGCRAGPDDA